MVPGTFWHFFWYAWVELSINSNSRGGFDGSVYFTYSSVYAKEQLEDSLFKMGTLKLGTKSSFS